MKRILGVVLSTALLVSLAGCSGGKQAATTSSTQKDVTLMLWQTPSDVTQVKLDLQSEFQKENPHIKLNIVQTPKDADILSAMAAGNAPAILENGYPSFSTLIYKGVYLPLDSYIEKTPDFKNFEKSQVETFAVNGKHYGIPGDKYALAIQYHKSLFEAAGITETPKTWDEFFTDCQKLTVPSKQQYGFALDGVQWACWHFEVWTWGAGGDVTKKNSDGTVSLTFTDPAAIQAAEFYRKLAKANVIQPDRNMQLDALSQDFALGKAAMIVGGLGDASSISKLGGKVEDIGFFNFPAGPGGKGYNIDGGDGAGIVYTKDKAQADAAWKYLMFMNSKDALIKSYQYKASQGPWTPIIPPRTDVDMSQFGTVSADVQKAVDDGAQVTKHEFYGKGAVSSYLDDAVAKIFGDSNADITATLKEAQTKAQSAADEFNAQIKKNN